MLSIIPARGGSKGVPGKNIRMLAGKPLIAYTIEAALSAKGIDRVVVTTDDDDIADCALSFGAEVPFMRPAELAKDTSAAYEAYLYTLDKLEADGGEPINKFMVLLPTSPFRTSDDIEAALELFEKKRPTSLVSMCESDTPPSWYYFVGRDGAICNAGLDKVSAIANRQESRDFYVPNGAIYILDKKLLETDRSYYDDSTIAYIMPRLRSIDIDTEDDFFLAESVMEYMRHRCSSPRQ